MWWCVGLSQHTRADFPPPPIVLIRALDQRELLCVVQEGLDRLNILLFNLEDFLAMQTAVPGEQQTMPCLNVPLEKSLKAAQYHLQLCPCWMIPHLKIYVIRRWSVPVQEVVCSFSRKVMTMSWSDGWLELDGLSWRRLEFTGQNRPKFNVGL